jgi:hypothetical protein
MKRSSLPPIAWASPWSSPGYATSATDRGRRVTLFDRNRCEGATIAFGFAYYQHRCKSLDTPASLRLIPGKIVSNTGNLRLHAIRIKALKWLAAQIPIGH